MNIEDLKTLKEKIIKNIEIDLEEVKEKVYEYKKKKSWNTKEWRSRRENLIKEKCEQCGSTDNLYIQHTWHPRRYSDIKRDISKKYGDILREKYPIDDLVRDSEILSYIHIEYKYIRRACCPICKSINIVEQKTLKPKYKCNKCKERFESVKVIEILVPKYSSTVVRKTYEQIKLNVKKKIYKEKIKKLKEELYQYDIEKETLLELINDNIRYLSMEDVKTYCKKCAFLEDIRGLDLCPICKKNYKKTYYEKCYECKNGSSYIKPILKDSELVEMIEIQEVNSVD